MRISIPIICLASSGDTCSHSAGSFDTATRSGVHRASKARASGRAGGGFIGAVTERDLARERRARWNGPISWCSCPSCSDRVARPASVLGAHSAPTCCSEKVLRRLVDRGVQTACPEGTRTKVRPTAVGAFTGRRVHQGWWPRRRTKREDVVTFILDDDPQGRGYCGGVREGADCSPRGHPCVRSEPRVVVPAEDGGEQTVVPTRTGPVAM